MYLIYLCFKITSCVNFGIPCTYMYTLETGGQHYHKALTCQRYWLNESGVVGEMEETGPHVKETEGFFEEEGRRSCGWGGKRQKDTSIGSFSRGSSTPDIATNAGGEVSSARWNEFVTRLLSPSAISLVPRNAPPPLRGSISTRGVLVFEGSRFRRRGNDGANEKERERRGA